MKIFAFSLLVVASAFTACKQQPVIASLSFLERSKIDGACSSPSSERVRRLTILQPKKNVSVVMIDTNPCRKQRGKGLSLADDAKAKVPAKSDKPLVIWASQYGTAKGDESWKASDAAVQRLKDQGYTVVDAHNKSGDELKTLVAQAAKDNPSERAILITNGHGAIESATKADGTAEAFHTITRTDVDDQGVETSKTLATNADVLQPALSGLGMSPDKVVSVVSSCQSGQCTADFAKTNPGGAIITSSASDQYSWLPSDKPELMIDRLTAVSDAKSAAFKTADVNNDGNLTTTEFTNYANGGGDANNQLAVINSFNVVYENKEGGADLEKIGTENAVFTQNPQGGGDETTLFKGAPSATATDPDYGSNTLGTIGAELEKNGEGARIHEASVGSYDAYLASQSIANRQIEAAQTLRAYDNDPNRAMEELQASGYSQEEVQAASEMNTKSDKYNEIVTRYGGDPGAATEELVGSGFSINSDDQTNIYVPQTQNFGDNGSGDWGMDPLGEQQTQQQVVPTGPEPTQATLRLTTATLRKGTSVKVAYHHPIRLEPSQSLFSYK